MSRRYLPRIFTVMLIIIGLARYFYNVPHIFDLFLDDEAVYMGVGTDFTHTILWPPGFKGMFSSYEYGGFYSMIYGALAQIIGDPIDLYLYGGVVIILSAALAGFLCVSILSENLVFGVIVVCPVVLSGELMTWPRVSFAAIAVMALAFLAMGRAAALRDKVSILLCAAYVLSFIRPEFILSFYAFLALQLASLLVLPLQRRRGVPIDRRSLALSILALAFVSVLSVLWSFPLPEGGERAFVAFGQHFAFRFVAAQHLAVNSWLDWRAVIADQFPGAHTVFQAVLTQPAKVLLFFATNAQDLILSIEQIVVATIRQNVVFSIAWSVCVVLWIGSVAWPSMRVAGTAQASPARTWPHIAFIALFGLPPLIATVTVYPRHHYILLLLFTASAAAAVLLRPLQSRLSPVLAPVLALAFAVSVQPLPVVEQPMLATAQALRRQPVIHRLFEIDGGWCYFLVPRCSTEPADWMPATASIEAYAREQGIDAIMLSPRLRAYEAEHSPGFAQGLDTLTTADSWRSIDLGQGYVLLLAPR
jgi:hypothetical protein